MKQLKINVERAARYKKFNIKQNISHLKITFINLKIIFSNSLYILLPNNDYMINELNEIP